ncbi:protein LAX PANICLE 2-like isoform X2 [Rhodamnia argentea]|uniref:Protein LAX PANICLE 2-like isoform X2 n=1 Tax=Rhodamnia argentea TaxID=178133 RepID=A0A8B8Q4L1_9MYRT|nr:protein LAX PANICLE 2-like isoform X2 [Rhodamnia argentea]
MMVLPQDRLPGKRRCNPVAPACAASDLAVGLDLGQMAEDESRTNSIDGEASSSSKDVGDQAEKDEAWLQLSICSHTRANNSDGKCDRIEPTGQGISRGVSVELDLLPSGCSWHSTPPPTPIFDVPNLRASRPITNFASGRSTNHSLSYLFQHPTGSSTFPTHGFDWPNFSLSSSVQCSSPSSSLMPPRPNLPPPFQLQLQVDGASGSSMDFRVIDAPKRPYPGVWFVLRASQNQDKEPFLPQIPKIYLRVKDGRMTVLLVMKYLVKKLRLDSESEIEITCRGQKLLPFLTLQQVRDNIWSPNEVVTLLRESATTSDHIMVLHYGRVA